jgi:hypothetical protein
MELVKSDHNKGLVTLTVITISGFYSKMYIGHLHKLVTKKKQNISSKAFLISIDLITLIYFRDFFLIHMGRKHKKIYSVMDEETVKKYRKIIKKFAGKHEETK